MHCIHQPICDIEVVQKKLEVKLIRRMKQDELGRSFCLVPLFPPDLGLTRIYTIDDMTGCFAVKLSTSNLAVTSVTVNSLKVM